jgi:periplasmic glucans biosynthesis protein
MGRSEDRTDRGSNWMCALYFAALLVAPGPVSAFSFEDVAREAAALARQPYRAPPAADAKWASLSYDDYRDIRFRPERSLWRDSGSLFQVQFFPLGRGFSRPLRLFEVDGATVRALEITAQDFSIGDKIASGPSAAKQAAAGAAGWRMTFPLHDAARQDEVVSFLGASYFRALGVGQVYGLSARGLAVDTAGAGAEEFPAFTAFWLERPTPGARAIRFHALLDGPRVVGAYSFLLRPGTDTVVEVQARLFLRAGVATLGIAPLTSMFLMGENQPTANDYRPEVHDSDGLLVESGDGERLWRPLTNPARPFVTSFALKSLRGFGLLQRDRAFASYEDLEAQYQRRPGAWVEPLGDWGPGRVELLQFGTPNETHDNIAAYWVPAQVPAVGTPLDVAWRLRWTLDAAPGSKTLARVLQTRRGHGYREAPIPPRHHQMHVDFIGPGLEGLSESAPIEAITSGNTNVRDLRAIAYRNPERGGWRATLDFERVDAHQPVELRLHLGLAGNVLSETWSYALAPD